jgi:hypothetical protein
VRANPTEAGFDREVEARGQHPQNRARLAAEQERTADHRRIAAETTSPVTLRQHDRTGCALHILRLGEEPAYQRARADDAEI